LLLVQSFTSGSRWLLSTALMGGLVTLLVMQVLLTIYRRIFCIELLKRKAFYTEEEAYLRSLLLRAKNMHFLVIGAILGSPRNEK